MDGLGWAGGALRGGPWPSPGPEMDELGLPIEVGLAILLIPEILAILECKCCKAQAQRKVSQGHGASLP